MSDPTPTTPTAAYPSLVDTLLGKVSITLSTDERAFYQSAISDEKAQQNGTTVESVAVLDDLIEGANIALPHILRGVVPGYGLLRLRYALELGRDLAVNVATFDTAVVNAAGASAGKTVTLRDTRGIRRRAKRALKNLAGQNEEILARIRKAARSSASQADERVRSLEAIAQELETLVATLPARVAADAGATPAFMDELRTYAKAVLASRNKAQDARGSVYAHYDVMNILDGRIVHELRQLAGATKDANADDPTIPRIRPRVIHRSGKPRSARPTANAGG